MKNFRPSFKLLFGAISLIAIFAFGVFSCKESSDVVNQDNQPTTSNSFLKFEGKALSHLNLSTKVFEKKNIGEENLLKFKIAQTEVNTQTMTYLLSKLEQSYKISLQTFKEGKTEGLTIYSKSTNLENLYLNDIVGISLLLPQDKGTNLHMLFKTNGKRQLIQDDTYTLKTDMLVEKDLAYIGSILIKDSQTINAICYTSSQFSNGGNSQTDFELSQAIFNNSDIILQTEDGCASSCSGGGFDCPISPGGGDGDQCNGLCPFSASLKIAQNSGARIASSLNAPNAYSVRDNFMRKTNIGKKYIDYYYKLSHVTGQHKLVNVKTFMNYLSVANKLVGIINTLESENSDEMVIDNDAKALFLGMIKQYRPLSKNKEFQTILNDIERDVNSFSLKSKFEVAKLVNLESNAK